MRYFYKFKKENIYLLKRNLNGRFIKFILDFTIDALRFEDKKSYEVTQSSGVSHPYEKIL